MAKKTKTNKLTTKKQKEIEIRKEIRKEISAWLFGQLLLFELKKNKEA